MVPLVVVLSNIVSWTLGMIFATATPLFDVSTATFVPDVLIGRVRVKLCPVYHKPFDVAAATFVPDVFIGRVRVKLCPVYRDPFDIIGVSCVPHTPTCC